MKPSIIVSRPIYPEVIDRLRTHFDVTAHQTDPEWTPQTWTQALSQHDGALTMGIEPVNAEVLAALGPAGYLINVARGSVVDEQALIEALQSGAIAGAALDVFADEPNVPRVLWDMPNLVLTPHMASATHQTRQAMADLAFANMEAVLAGRPALTPVPECLAAQHPQR